MSGPARRSHAERTAETRARIVAAVVESIAAVGFQRTTAVEIARRAGVTWGAVQHHFGGKDGILLAVLQDSFGRFADRLSEIPTEGTSLEKRVGEFVDRAWEHFASPHYRSTFEILLNVAVADGPKPELIWQSRMFAEWNRMWDRLFPDTGLTRPRSVVLQEYAISVLSGMAATQALGSTRRQVLQAQLDLLKDTLIRELSRPR